MLGCRLTGLDLEIHPEQIKQLIVYVEMDRCTADAVAHVTGVKLGRRSLKHADYGIMAATFLRLDTGDAFRICSTEEARDLTDAYSPHTQDRLQQAIDAYKRMPDSVLFRVQQVDVDIDDADLPGPTRYRVICSKCGQAVRDRRERIINGKPYCRPCIDGAYFTNAREITWPGMNWRP